jgi:hypothetical protein
MTDLLTESVGREVAELAVDAFGSTGLGPVVAVLGRSVDFALYERRGKFQ